ncbi:MAG TPA: DUF1572 family protein [Chitinophagaceae bacterium]|nr:DUF1572 family protein [Chitinophagaceae bacterium]
MQPILFPFFERDLNKLIEEISLYKNGEDIWNIREGINNSAGNLTLHIVGNLKHFIGATLGKTGYVRERDKEFSLKNIPRDQLVAEVKDTIHILKNTLSRLSEEDLEKDFPLPINHSVSSTVTVLIYLLAHLNYHLGQVNYHRRLIG